MKLIVYLAGWAEEIEYRKYVEKKYNSGKLELLNPMNITHLDVIDNIGINEYSTYIIRRDKKMILSSDILVAYISDHGPSWGTSMEINFAYENGIPVYVIDVTDGMKHANNAWVKFHTKKSFKNIDDCFDFITNK